MVRDFLHAERPVGVGPLRAGYSHRLLHAALLEQHPDVSQLTLEALTEAIEADDPVLIWTTELLRVAMQGLRISNDLTPSDRAERLTEFGLAIDAAARKGALYALSNVDLAANSQLFFLEWIANRSVANLLPAFMQGDPSLRTWVFWESATSMAAAHADEEILAVECAESVLKTLDASERSIHEPVIAAMLIEAAYRLGRSDISAAAAELLRHRSGQGVVPPAGTVLFGPVDRYLGLAAVLAGDPAARGLLEGAAEQASITGQLFFRDLALEALSS